MSCKAPPRAPFAGGRAPRAHVQFPPNVAPACPEPSSISNGTEIVHLDGAPSTRLKIIPSSASLQNICSTVVRARSVARPGSNTVMFGRIFGEVGRRWRSVDFDDACFGWRHIVLQPQRPNRTSRYSGSPRPRSSSRPIASSTPLPQTRTPAFAPSKSCSTIYVLLPSESKPCTNRCSRRSAPNSSTQNKEASRPRGSPGSSSHVPIPVAI
ncbi:hypothetical protein OF83DRAFT_1286835 [Amylostereum chailletii]|nr:hypothetical protein OF83DRAFT_1286835 [Amylostereum chailletii]